MTANCARLFVAASLVFGAHQLLVAQGAWTYPPAVSLDELREHLSRVSPEHPRLLVQPGQLEGLRRWASADPVRQAMASALVRRANRILDDRPIAHTMDGRRLLRQSRTCVQRVLILSMAYHLTGDQRYAARCQREMVAAARFPDWNPSHFLDVAEMTFALGIGYDWLHSQLEPDARAEIRQAIVEKGLSLAFDDRYSGWVRLTDNWGQVCHGGLTVGALAVLEDEPDLAARTIDNALRNVPAAMAAYAPAGAYPEGPRYWTYGTSFNVLLIAALERIFGTDFGLSHAPGFDETGQFLSVITGPTGGMFNYADSEDERNASPALLWLASHYGRPDWLLGERARVLQSAEAIRRGESEPGRGRLAPLALLWWESPEEGVDIRMPLHWSSEGQTPVAVHRSSWTDPDATYVALKAGSPAYSHGQMDIGSFVLEADGVRWAIDSGSEEYGPVEARGMSLWRYSQDSDRWKIFRQNNFSHNTLVIDGQLQRATGSARIVAFSADPAFPYSVIDMSAVYEGQATTVQRGVALITSGEVLIQDELTGLQPGSRVRWGMMTTGHPRDSNSPLVIRKDGQALTLTALSETGEPWETIDTSDVLNEWDSANPDARMVTFTVVAPSDGALTIRVLATPGSRQQSGSEHPVLPLSDWGQGR